MGLFMSSTYPLYAFSFLWYIMNMTLRAIFTDGKEQMVLYEAIPFLRVDLFGDNPERRVLTLTMTEDKKGDLSLLRISRINKDLSVDDITSIIIHE